MDEKLDQLIRLAVLCSDCLLSRFIYEAYCYAEIPISMDKLYEIHQSLLEGEPPDEVVESYALDIASDRIKPVRITNENQKKH